MKTRLQTRVWLLGATLVGNLLLTAPPVRADIINQTLTQGLGTNWNQATWGTPEAVPASTNDYVTPSGFDVRTQDAQTPSTFLGKSLQIESGGRLLLKNGGADAGLATAHLILNGGSIIYNTANGTTISAVGGTLQVLADSVVNSTAGTVNTRDIWLRSTLSGSANLSVGMSGYGLVLWGTNTGFSGNWTIDSGRIELASNSRNALGSGSVMLPSAAAALTFNATNDLSVTNLIDGAGSVVKLNTNTVTWSGDNSNLYGTVVVSNGVLKIQSATAMANALVLTLAGGTLDASPIGGLILNPGVGQTLNCRGTVAGSLTAVSGTVLNFNLSVATNDILNATGSLTLDGNPTLSLSLAGFKANGVYRLINYSGTILGGGSFSLAPPAGSVAVYALDTTTPGQVNLTVTNSANSQTWVGDGGANQWDNISPNWAGAVSTYADGDSVTFDDSGSAVPNIFVSATVYPQSMTVSNTAQPYAFDNAGIISSGLLTKKGNNDLVFNNANNFTGPVSIEAGLLSIGSGGTTGFLGNVGNITNNGVLRVNLTAGGHAFSNSISGSGALEVTGGPVTVTLHGTNSYTGLTTIGNDCQLNITTSSALGSAAAGTVILANGRLGVATYVGSMTVPEPLTVNGFGIAAAPGALYLNSVSNNLTYSGPVTIASASRFRVLNASARMTFANTVQGTDVALQCTAGNTAEDTNTAVVFQNSFSLGNGALTTDGPGWVIFESNANVAGSTTVNGGALLVKGQFNGGPVTVNSGATVGGSGTILDPVSVADGGSLAPGNAGIGTLTLNNTLTLAATATTRMEINRTNAQNADLLVAGAVPMNGTLTVVSTGPTPQVGDTFNLFDGVMSGAFTNMNLPALAYYNHAWDTSRLASLGTITVVSNALPVLPLLITKTVKQPTNVVLTWNSYPGLFYTIQYLLDVSKPNWATLKTNIPAAAQTNTTTYAVDTTGADSGNNIVVAQYQMGTVNAQIQNATNLVAAGPLTKGVGTSLFNAAASLGYPSGLALQATAVSLGADLTAAMANQTWFTFTLTVGTGVTNLNLTSLTFNGARGGGSTPRGYAVYVSTPTAVDELVQPSTAFATQRPTWSPQNINLSGFASLQNLWSGQVVTIKIPFFAPAAASSVEFDDITVIGNVTPGPVPPYVGAGQMFLRMKQQ